MCFIGSSSLHVAGTTSQCQIVDALVYVQSKQLFILLVRDMEILFRIALFH